MPPFSQKFSEETIPDDSSPKPPEEVTGIESAEDLAELVSKWRHRIPLIQIIPKGARICVADALADTLRKVRTEGTLMAWTQYFSFTFSCLRKPSGKDHSESLTSAIKRQTRCFIEQYQLPSLPPPNSGRSVRDAPSSTSKTSEAANDKLRKLVASKIADGDIKAAVRAVAGSDGLAAGTDGVIEALRSKHPTVPADLNLPDPLEPTQLPPASATEAEVMRALMSFPPSTSAGMDGIRAKHIVNLVSKSASAAGDQLRHELTAFVNYILRGELPAFILPLFYGARLIALDKKDGGIRPIAVGKTLRRLATKAGMSTEAIFLGDDLSPLQLGFGVRGGCEAAVHAVRRYVENCPTDRITVMLDIRNAFNTIRRDIFLHEARQRLPGLYRLLWQAYSRESLLHFNESVILSQTRIQQGDPAGPALFAIGVDKVARASRKSDLSVWYLDDATLAGKPTAVLEDLENILPRLHDIGLQVNDSKCQLYAPSEALADISTHQRLRDLLPGMRLLEKAEIRLLGASVMVEGVNSIVEEKHEELVRLTNRIKELDPHTGFSILKNCVAVPKLTYTLRTTPFYRVDNALGSLDAVITNSVMAVTNVNMSDFSLSQSQLPVRMGGIGVRRLSDIAAPAYLSSLHSTAQLSESIIQNSTDLAESDEISRAIEHWETKVLTDDETVQLPRKPENPKSQKQWDLISLQRQHSALLAVTDQISRSRLLAASCPESGQWLHAFPSPALGTHLDAEAFRIAIAHRVGAEVCQPHRCRCGGQVDRLGLHPLSCRYSSGRAARHAAANNIIARGLHAAGLPSIIEPVGLSRSDGRRPDGMTTFPLKNGLCLVWDFTCVDAYARSHLSSSALTPGLAATTAEALKRSKYTDIAERHIFEPIAVETSGAYGQSTKKFRDLGRRIAVATGDIRETMYLQQRIGIAIARGNAMCVTVSGSSDHFPAPLSQRLDSGGCQEAPLAASSRRISRNNCPAKPPVVSIRTMSLDRLSASPAAATRTGCGERPVTAQGLSVRGSSDSFAAPSATTDQPGGGTRSAVPPAVSVLPVELDRLTVRPADTPRSSVNNSSAAPPAFSTRSRSLDQLAALSSPSARSGSCERLGTALDTSVRESNGGVVPTAALSAAPSVVGRCGPFGPLVMHAEKLAPCDFEIPWGQLFGARPKHRESGGRVHTPCDGQRLSPPLHHARTHGANPDPGRGQQTAREHRPRRNRAAGGPGQRVSSQEPEPDLVKPAAPVPAVPEPAQPVGSGGYVPPHRRNLPPGADSGGGSSGSLQSFRMNRNWNNKKAPDIRSDETFPTNGSAVEEVARGAWGQ